MYCMTCKSYSIYCMTSRSLETPHTITGWDAEAVCISPLSGLGVATPANLTVSQVFNFTIFIILLF